jgi:hypothetical protein
MKRKHVESLLLIAGFPCLLTGFLALSLAWTGVFGAIGILLWFIALALHLIDRTVPTGKRPGRRHRADPGTWRGSTIPPSHIQGSSRRKPQSDRALRR